MVDASYEKLIGALNIRSTTFPAVKCDEFFNLISFLFTPEEAAIGCAMPIGFSTIDKIAKNLDIKDLHKLAGQLETMGDKGLIHIKEVGGQKLYSLLPLMPGSIELQFIQGIVDERHKKMALLLRSYIKALKWGATWSTPPKLETSATARKVPVDQEIYHRSTIIPYKEMQELIENTDYIAAGVCYCRHWGAIFDKACSKPQDNCMIFGASAKFAVERGFVTRLTKEEAQQKLDESEKAGLVHQYSNAEDHISNILCNCCGCHCFGLKGYNKSPVPSQAVIARYLIQIDVDDCIECEACIERCQTGALKMENNSLTRDEKRCIGCGLCMYVCPTDALTLETRAAGKVPLKKC